MFKTRSIAWGRAYLAAAFASTFVAGCGQQSKQGKADEGPPLAEVTHARTGSAAPATVALTATTVESGFAGGSLRETVTVDALRITRHPITRLQYAACVAAGECTKSREDGCNGGALEHLGGRSLGKAASPQVCVSVKEASHYCEWVGGRLPTLPEWLLAARGPSPRRFAWGESVPTCSQHPRAAEMVGAFKDEASMQEAGCVPASEQALVVGEYPEGAAPSGVQDVLLTPAELVAAQDDAQFSACSSGFAGCTVYGALPGSIDSVYPIAKVATNDNARPPVYGFRCVLEGK